MPDTVVIRDVELVRAGSWSASTGPVTITTDDLEAIVTAAGDAEVDRAAVRIGHVDPRFDGEPALGWVENLRVTGDRLLGDLVEVPAMLAELIPRAFRRRSVEIAWQVRTAAGKQYRAALTGLALLGVAPPAVKGLADVAALYGRTAATGAAGSTVYVTTSSPAAADGVTAASSSTVELGADVELGPADDLVAAAMTAVAAGFDQLRTALAAGDGASIPASGDEPAQNGDRDHEQPPGGDGMPVDESRIRELLGLEAEADIEAELTRIAATIPATPPAPTAGDDTPDGADGADGDEPTGDTPDGDEPTEPTATDPLVPELATLSASALSELQRQAAAGARAEAQLAAQRRDGIIATALSQGRIAPADSDRWREALEADEQRTATLLSSLTPAFPTSELGADHGADVEPDGDAWDSFMAETFGIDK